MEQHIKNTWKNLKKPVIEKRCSTCIHFAGTGACGLWVCCSDRPEGSPYFKLTSHWQWDGRNN